MGEVFDWMVEELKYKYITVDLSNGYTDELVNELAEYLILQARLLRAPGGPDGRVAMRLGHEAAVVPGLFLSDDRTEWVEHAW